MGTEYVCIQMEKSMMDNGRMTKDKAEGNWTF